MTPANRIKLYDRPYAEPSPPGTTDYQEESRKEIDKLTEANRNLRSRLERKENQAHCFFCATIVLSGVSVGLGLFAWALWRWGGQL